MDSSGNIYVVDIFKDNIKKFDLNGNLLLEFGSIGADNGQFLFANSIALDSSGNLYVTDREKHRLQVFKPDVDTDKGFSDVALGGITSGRIIHSGDKTLTITDFCSKGIV